MKILTILILSIIFFECSSINSDKQDYKATRSDKEVTKTNSNLNQEIDCDKCNIDLVRDIRLNIDSLNEEKILKFLTCFNKACFNNVEFGEAANYSLFILLQKFSDKVIAVLDSNKQLDIDYIKFALENPVSDDLDINEVIESIEAVDTNLEVKKELIKSLEIAIKKYE